MNWSDVKIVGDRVEIDSAYKINPEFYECELVASAPWPDSSVGELMTFGDDPRLWRVMSIRGHEATVRLMPQKGRDDRT